MDGYRVEREWLRYEGNPLRELFLELRVRFLRRHPTPVPGPALEVGPGPGRFSPHVGGTGHERVLLDLSARALLRARARLAAGPEASLVGTELVRGDGNRLPFRDESFAQVVLLGNVAGFAGPSAERILLEAARVLSPGGELLIESVAGPGEYSRYLHRLPPKVVGRLLAAPASVLLPRIAREGFRPRGDRRTEREAFERMGVERLDRILASRRLARSEAMAVAPALGHDPERVSAAHAEAKSWGHLIEIEEQLGTAPERLRSASALLAAFAKEGGPAAATVA